MTTEPISTAILIALIFTMFVAFGAHRFLCVARDALAIVIKDWGWRRRHRKWLGPSHFSAVEKMKVAGDHVDDRVAVLKRAVPGVINPVTGKPLTFGTVVACAEAGHPWAKSFFATWKGKIKS